MKYYLINNKIMKGSKMPPTTIAVNEDYAKTEALKYHYQELYSRWKTTLQPCEISESELEKIEMYITKNMSMYMDFSNPIDITDIVSAQVICNTDRCDGECIECTNMVLKVKFKQPTEKQVDEYGYIKCGDCNKFYLCTNCGAQCGSEGHFIEPKQVDGEIEAVDVLLNTFGQFCTLNGIKLTDSNKVGQAVIDFLKSDIYEIFKNRK